MGKDLKGDHLKFMKDANQNMKDFIVKPFPQADTKVRKRAFRRDIIHGDARIGTVTPTSVFVMKDIKEVAHILMSVDISKEIQEKQAWRVITGRAEWGIAMCNQGSDEREIDQ